MLNWRFASTDERGRSRNLGSFDFIHRNIYSVSQRGPTPPQQARPEEYAQNPRGIPAYSAAIRAPTVLSNPNPHDMSKQALPPQPTIPGSSPANHPIPGHTPMMYSNPQTQNTRPQTPGTAFFRPTARQVSTNVQQRNISGVPMTANQQPIFGQQLQAMVFPGMSMQSPVFLSQPNQHSLPVNYSDVFRNPSFNQNQYPLAATTQAQFMQSVGASTYYQPAPNAPGVYYSTPTSMPVAQNRPTSVQLTNSGPVPLPVKEKKIIVITEPVSGRDITKEVLNRDYSSNSITPPQSTPISSARATPPVNSLPSQQNVIAAQFAAQVAATLSPKAAGTMTTTSSAKNQGSNEKVEISNDIKFHNINSLDSNTDKIEIKSTPITDNKLQIKEHIDSTDSKSLEKLNDKTQDNKDKIKVSEIKASLSSEQIKSDVCKSEEIEKPETKIVNMEKNIDKKDSRTENIKLDKKDIKSDNKNEIVKEKSAAKLDSQPVNVKMDKTIISNGDSVNSLTISTKIHKEEQQQNIPELKDIIPKENGEIDISVINTTVVADLENEAKENKKSKGKKKIKEINRRGEAKEGTDMDAFTDKEIHIVEDHVNKNTIEYLNDINEDALVINKNERNESRAMSADSDRSSSDESRKDKSEIKLNYKEDQWSPHNPEGKRHYDRTFLLQMQFQPVCLEKPDGLPKLEVVKDIANKPRNDNRIMNNVNILRSFSNTPDFTPGYVKSSPRPPGSMGRRTCQQGKQRETRKIIPNVSLNTDVKLHETENAWRPPHLKDKEVDEEILTEKEATEKAESEDLYRKFRGILNKLTPQKFDTLLQQIQDLKIDNELRLKGVIDLVFDKAVDEPSFSVAYASLCKCLGTIKVPVEGGAENQCVNFRKILLNRCQKEFEKDINEELAQNKLYKALEEADLEEKKKQISEEIEDLENKVKRRSIGNIRFIGELFKLKMLTEKIMHECIVKLLRQNDEDSFECLCRLLTTIGADIDNEKEKLDRYFTQMTKIVEEKKISSRVRFMILDVIDLRSSGWKPRRDENNPKTIDQIHREAEQELREQQLILQQASQHPKRNDDRRRGGRGGGNGGMGQSEEGWNTVGNKNRGFDPAKLKLTKVTTDDNIQLGSAGHTFCDWVKGSSGGVSSKGSNQDKGTKTSVPTNRFLALGEQSSNEARNNRSGTANRDTSKGRGNTQLAPTQRSKPSSNRDNREKEQAIATVKTMTGASASQRLPRSRDGSSSREYLKESEKELEKVTLSRETHDLTVDEMEKKTKTILDEFLHLNDIGEAIQCVKELNSPGTMHVFVSTAIDHVLERSAQARHVIGNFLYELVKRNILSFDVYVNGLKSVLDLVDDMSIDIPLIWSYLGELIGPMMQDRSLPLNFLKQIAHPVMGTSKAGIFIAEILNAAVKISGSQKIGEFWKASGLQWSDFLPSTENLQQFIEKNKLEFTGCESERRVDSSLSIEAIRNHLTYLMSQKNEDNEGVFDWVETHVGEGRTKEPEFIRAVMAAVCESAIKGTQSAAEIDIEQFRRRCNLFQRYLDHKESLELQALYELQAVNNRLDHPPGMLRLIFDTLYDEEVISEEAFNSWEKSTDPNELEGRGVALKSLVQFYTWLRTAVDESDDV